MNSNTYTKHAAPNFLLIILYNSYFNINCVTIVSELSRNSTIASVEHLKSFVTLGFEPCTFMPCQGEIECLIFQRVDGDKTLYITIPT